MRSQIQSRRLERLSLFLITGVLSLGFFSLYVNLRKQLKTAESGYKSSAVINLAKGVNSQNIQGLLLRCDYVSDSKDARLIAQHIAKKLETEALPNLGTLNLKAFRMSADSAYKYGGDDLRKRVEHSFEMLGLADTVLVNYTNPALKQTFSAKGGDQLSINVKVVKPDASVTWIRKYLFHKISVPVTGVLVQLKEYSYDSYQRAQSSVVGYALTDEAGIASFVGLKNHGYYSVLPVKSGFEYGASKGTTRGALGEMDASKRNFTFTESPHQLSPFGTFAYSQLKEKNVLTVRTPQQFEWNLLMHLLVFFLAWWLLHIFFCLRKKNVDQLLAPLLMTMSGIGLLIMYSIANPLTDKMLGNEMANGAAVGVLLIALLSEIDFVKFFNSHYRWKLVQSQSEGSLFFHLRFDFFLQFLAWLVTPFAQKVKQIKIKGKLTVLNVTFFYLGLLVFLLLLPLELLLRFVCYLYQLLPRKFQFVKLPEGSGYLLFALCLAGLLFVFGGGPEGSGVRVNLFFFQPSEVTKYLIVFFLASFFVLNKRDEKIQTFSQSITWKSFGLQGRTVGGVIVGLILLLVLYLLLGDMGPALVLTISFIVIYSVARRDFHYLVTGTVSFVLLLFIGHKVGGGSHLYLALATFLWLGGWLLYGYLKPQKQLYESAVFMNIVIATFIFGSNLPKVGQRLQDRNEMYANVWNNEVNGGDQVVQGLWSLSSGGLVGQGLGEGQPDLVPAFHTDMIFTSIGEEIGWIGLLLIVASMAILLHRTLLIGRKAGHPFAFYLVTGIAVVTGVQFLVITLGSIGLIPLTGVTAPFLSYGKTSLILNLAAFGVVFSVSKLTARQYQKTYQETYKLMVAYTSFAYSLVSLLILAVLLWYQFFAQNSTLIRPACVSNKEGARTIEYNPRIKLLMNKLHAGNIYDRKGLILATNERELLADKAISHNILSAGIAEQDLSLEIEKDKTRYYPFGNNLFFMLGDFNTKLLWNDSDDDPHGFVAERRYSAPLRGFDNLKYNQDGTIARIDLTAKDYKPTPFIPSAEKSYRYPDYDYTALLPLLKDGLEGNEVKKWNQQRQQRDIILTLDAALQTKMQTQISNYVKENFNDANWNKLRVSVVVLDAQDGDLLCSANYPLPDQNLLRNLPFVYDEKNKNEKAYTDRDLGLTFQTAPGSTAKVMSAMAGLQKLGPAAASKTYYVDSREAIEAGIEPRDYRVTMEDAIVKSSNCYFINLVNDQNLYQQLDSIYSVVGIRIDQHLATSSSTRFRSLTPYYLQYEPASKAFKAEIKSVGANAVRLYQDYVLKRERNGVYEKMSGYAPNSGHVWNSLAWAWGQGTLRATPLNMARIASIVANKGQFSPTQYLLKGNANLIKTKHKPVVMLSSNAAGLLKEYMTTEAMEEQERRNAVSFKQSIGGKTGTPERELRYTLYDPNGKPRTNRKGKIVTEFYKPNDGWYVFFTNSTRPLAVAVRMERLFSAGSGAAVRLTDKVVLKVLEDAGYFQGNKSQ